MAEAAPLPPSAASAGSVAVHDPESVSSSDPRAEVEPGSQESAGIEAILAKMAALTTSSAPPSAAATSPDATPSSRQPLGEGQHSTLDGGTAGPAFASLQTLGERPKGPAPLPPPPPALAKGQGAAAPTDAGSKASNGTVPGAPSLRGPLPPPPGPPLAPLPAATTLTPQLAPMRAGPDSGTSLRPHHQQAMGNDAAHGDDGHNSWDEAEGHAFAERTAKGPELGDEDNSWDEDSDDPSRSRKPHKPTRTSLSESVGLREPSTGLPARPLPRALPAAVPLQGKGTSTDGAGEGALPPGPLPPPAAPAKAKAANALPLAGAAPPLSRPAARTDDAPAPPPAHAAPPARPSRPPPAQAPTPGPSTSNVSQKAEAAAPTSATSPAPESGQEIPPESSSSQPTLATPPSLPSRPPPAQQPQRDIRLPAGLLAGAPHGIAKNNLEESLQDLQRHPALALPSVPGREGDRYLSGSGDDDDESEDEPPAGSFPMPTQAFQADSSDGSDSEDYDAGKSPDRVAFDIDLLRRQQLSQPGRHFIPTEVRDDWRGSDAGAAGVQATQELLPEDDDEEADEADEADEGDATASAPAQFQRYRQQDAIRKISQVGARENKNEAAWIDAAWWEAAEVAAEEVEQLLAHYGYRLADPDHWLLPPERGGPELNLLLDEHIERAGHTWYLITCTLQLAAAEVNGACLNWLAPRRLWHLQNGLHDPVKRMLGTLYSQHFGEAPFARPGGPSGTTQRLQDWLATLASVINSGRVSPHLAAIALDFFQAEGAQIAISSHGQAGRPFTAASAGSTAGGGGVVSKVKSFFGRNNMLDSSAQSLLESQRISMVDEAWSNAVSKKLSKEGLAVTKVANKGKPQERRVHIDSQNLVFQIHGGQNGNKGIPLETVLDVCTGPCSPEFAKFTQTYRRVLTADELKKRALVLQTQERTYSLLFQTEAQRDTVGLFTVYLLKSRSFTLKRRQPKDKGGAATVASDFLLEDCDVEPPREGYGRVMYGASMRYEGQFKNHMRHGQGAATLADGTKYDCEWIEDQRHGAGSEHWSDGTVFRGFYADNQRCGHGVMTWPEGARYDGQFMKHRANGQGTLVRMDGTVYVGEFRDDTMFGEGEMKWAGGVTYKGQFTNNLRDGYGSMLWVSGKWANYTGQWANGSHDGTGVLTDHTGKEFSGVFSKGVLQYWNEGVDYSQPVPDPMRRGVRVDSVRGTGNRPSSAKASATQLRSNAGEGALPAKRPASAQIRPAVSRGQANQARPGSQGPAPESRRGGDGGAAHSRPQSRQSGTPAAVWDAASTRRGKSGQAAGLQPNGAQGSAALPGTAPEDAGDLMLE